MKIKRTDLSTALILNFMYLLLGFMTGESIFWILLAINSVLLIVPAIYRYEKEKKEYEEELEREIYRRILDVNENLKKKKSKDNKNSCQETIDKDKAFEKIINDKTKKEKTFKYDVILFVFFSVIYIFVSLLTDAWHITWVIWIIYALLSNTIHNYMK